MIPSVEDEPGFKKFLPDPALSGDVATEELDFLKSATFQWQATHPACTIIGNYKICETHFIFGCSYRKLNTDTSNRPSQAAGSAHLCRPVHELDGMDKQLQSDGRKNIVAGAVKGKAQSGQETFNEELETFGEIWRSRRSSIQKESSRVNMSEGVMSEQLIEQFRPWTRTVLEARTGQEHDSCLSGADSCAGDHRADTVPAAEPESCGSDGGLAQCWAALGTTVCYHRFAGAPHAEAQQVCGTLA